MNRSGRPCWVEGWFFAEIAPVISPMIPDFCARIIRAAFERTYPNSRIAASTASRVFSPTGPSEFSTRLTVFGETPARRATS
jgi:hypothetical protein